MSPRRPRDLLGPAGAPRRTVVAVHAHPDDEALLTGGTLAMLAAAGHRVVLVVATDGGRGLSDPAAEVGSPLAGRRAAELDAAAAALGVARVVRLGYRDSGWDGTDVAPTADGFAAVPVAEAAARVAEVLSAERADLVIGYDASGGYGHPDHRHVHAVVAAAAAVAGTPRLLEATADRTTLRRALRLLTRLHLVPEGTEVAAVDGGYTDRAELTHRVVVWRGLGAKRRAMASHVSQRLGGDGVRTLELLLRLPRPLFAVAAGREWFREPGTPPGTRVRRDLRPTGVPRGLTRSA